MGQNLWYLHINILEFGLVAPSLKCLVETTISPLFDSGDLVYRNAHKGVRQQLDVSTYTTRSSNPILLIIPRKKTIYGRSAFEFAAPNDH